MSDIICMLCKHFGKAVSSEICANCSVNKFEDSCCSCHINPPCSYCIELQFEEIDNDAS